MVDLRLLSDPESNLLLYVEHCAVDCFGRLDTKKMNAEDIAILDRWRKAHFVDSGRIRAKDCTAQGSMWSSLSTAAWTAAHAERKARAERMWEKRTWLKTSEK